MATNRNKKDRFRRSFKGSVGSFFNMDSPMTRTRIKFVIELGCGRSLFKPRTIKTRLTRVKTEIPTEIFLTGDVSGASLWPTRKQQYVRIAMSDNSESSAQRVS